MVGAPEPNLRGSRGGSCNTHAYTDPQTHTLLAHPAHTPQRAAPCSTPVAKKTGSAADTCAKERKSERSQRPLLSSPHPSATAAAFIVRGSLCKAFNI